MESPDDEALRRERGHAYGGVIDELPQQQYVAAAQAVLSRLSPEQRKRLVQTLRDRARLNDVNDPGLHEVQSLDEPHTLGGLFGHMRLNTPGLLEQLLDGSEFYETVFGGMDALARQGRF